MSLTNKVVRLTTARRAALEERAHTGACSAHSARRARILLKADANRPDAWTDERIAEARDVCRMTVMRARQRFAAEGLSGTLRERWATDRRYRALDGRRRFNWWPSPVPNRPKDMPAGPWSCWPGAWSS